MPDRNTPTRPAPTEKGTLSAGHRQQLATEPARRALAKRDIGAVYRLLAEAGVSQHQIARLTGQSQSEVWEIVKGRRVLAYDVLVRIAEGLEVPRGWMGLAYDEDEVVESAGLAVGEEVVDEEMKRRVLLAAGSVALLGAPVLGEVLELPTPPNTPTPLPSRLGASDVAALKELTAQLRTLARTYGGGADVVTAVANWSRLLMSVSASDTIKAELGSALADLHTLAGWCCVDSGLHDQARACFATAMDLAAGDGVQMASALWHAGIQMRDAGAYNDGLKACQLGLIKLGEAPDSPGAAEAAAWLNVESARVLAAMGHNEAAERSLKIAREWRPATAYDVADMDCVTSYVYLWLGRLDTAESFAASSVHKWAAEGTSRREGVLADIALATIHTQTGQSDAAVLAQRAIAGVAPLRSLRTRRVKLAPLVQALDTRADSTSRDLAHHARQLARSA